MIEIRKKTNFDIEQLAEEHFVEAPTNLPGCQCADEHHLHVALSEQRGRPVLFSPDHKALKNAYCETYGRRCKG